MPMRYVVCLGVFHVLTLENTLDESNFWRKSLKINSVS